MTRWKAVCGYDGTDFFGWQSQAEGNTIQDIIESALEKLLKQPVRIHGSGRTDAGVHAKAQVFHFDAAWKHSAEELFNGLGSELPLSIQVATLTRTTKIFHARYSAKRKCYVYHFFQGYAPPMETRYCWSLGKRPLDLERMQEAAIRLLGKHDFTAYSALRRGNKGDEDPIKDLSRLEIIGKGSRIKMVTEASGYMYKMARSLAGTLVEVGLGKLGPNDMERILKSRKRTKEVITAPAKGLVLERVFY